jgi:hypothetical protein
MISTLAARSDGITEWALIEALPVVLWKHIPEFHDTAVAAVMLRSLDPQCVLLAALAVTCFCAELS